MIKRNILFILALLNLLVSCVDTNTETGSKPAGEESFPKPTNKVVLSSEIVWEQLNPARGDQSPQAGTIWGDRNGTEATGFLAKFVDGFSSPPHIHNVTYRAVVLKGLIHNDDPNAEKMWMPEGSFWTQPAGEAHITAAKGDENIAYVEIDSGPYLVKPTAEAFDNGERPVNIDQTNIVWLNASKTTLIEVGQSMKSPAIAFLWEHENRTGNFIKLTSGFEGMIISEGSEFRAVVISGEANYELPNSDEIKVLDSGSYFTSTGKARHSIKVMSDSEVIFYIRTNGKILIK